MELWVKTAIKSGFDATALRAAVNNVLSANAPGVVVAIPLELLTQAIHHIENSWRVEFDHRTQNLIVSVNERSGFVLTEPGFEQILEPILRPLVKISAEQCQATKFDEVG